MIRVLVILAAMILAGTGVLAQEPRVTVELDRDTTIVGQPVTLRISVLVPTWMPEPPVFPAIERPSLLVRQPQRASGPISETVDGDTWSGVRRSYRLYPLSSGSFILPASEIGITFTDPDTNQPARFVSEFPQTTFTATVPEAALDLDPLIIASGFELDQQLDADPELTVGGAATRSVTARITGTTPLMIPQLIKDPDTDILRAYPKDPRVREQEDRGVLSGTRTETVAYVAQDGGSVILPELSVKWYNTDSETVETASLPEIGLTVSGSAPGGWQLLDFRAKLERAALLLGTVAALVFLANANIARLRKWRYAARARLIDSEWFAKRKVLRAIRSRHLSSVSIAVSEWRRHFPDAPEPDFDEFSDAMTTIGRAHFGKTPAPAPEHWRSLSADFVRLRRRLRANQARHGPGSRLRDLNPDWKK